MKPCSMAPKFDGVVKTLHLVRCYNFSIITTYPVYASNMKFFTYPSNMRFLRVNQILVGTFFVAERMAFI